MGTAVRTFSLPRLSLMKDPRKVSRALRTAPLPVPEPDPIDSLAEWESGFSVNAATDHLANLGARMPSRPLSDPRMPDDVTSLPSDHLGMLHAQFVSYVEWLEAELALCEVDADEQAAFLEHVDAEIRLRKAGTVADKAAKTKNDPRYVQTELVALSSKAKAKLLRARVKGYERCASALSREMTRRVPVE